MVKYNIFKYRHELPRERPRRHWPCVITGQDWPEAGDRQTATSEWMKKSEGKPYDEALIAACVERSRRMITPASIYGKLFWEDEDLARLQPDPWKRGRPPYFFDP